MSPRTPDGALIASAVTPREGFLTGPDPGDQYWGEIPREEFAALTDAIRAGESFGRAVRDFIREHPRKDLYPYITDPYGRGAWHHLLEDGPRSVALDLGAGMGGISEFLCPRYERVYAVEGCEERCEFLALRKRRQRLDNLEIVHSNIYELPFADRSLDLVVCNGVLEWVGVGRSGPVPKVQEDFLREIARTLADDGILYVGIENRFGHQYFRGALDHCGRRYTSLMPRWVANLIENRANSERFSFESRQGGYRTWTWTAKGYRKLLRRAGFADVAIFATEPSYNVPRSTFPLDDPRAADVALRTFEGRRLRRVRDRFFCSNFFMFASRGDLAGRVVRRPTFFGYHDVLTTDGETVVRRGKEGGVLEEPVIDGRPLVPYEGRPVRGADVVAAYEHFLAGDAGRRPSFDPEGCRRELDEALADVFAERRRVELLERIARDHAAERYHGDFWAGNLLADRAGKLHLFDPEPHAFGSRALDGVDFLLDLRLNAAMHGRGLLERKCDLEPIREAFGASLEDRDLVTLAIARKVMRYSPGHRSHAFVYDYLPLAEACARGDFAFLKAEG